MLIADGPFAETKEQIAGYDIVECADLDEAIEIATRHPCARSARSRSGRSGGVTSDDGAAASRAFPEEWGRLVAARSG